VIGISLVLQSPESDIPLESLAGDAGYIGNGLDKEWIRPLEGSTSLDRDGFYREFAQDDSECFAAPIGLW
jgi:hypothetical protein